MNNFWEKLEKPIYALAPMAGITDSAFRQICKSYGADVVYSEMASATALFYNPKETIKMLKFSEKERPYVVQLFGGEPKHFARAVELVEENIKPDGIDINFGCPVKKVLKQGAGAVLMDDLKTANEIVREVLGSTKLPVSIKTRIKGKKIVLADFLKPLKDLDIKAIMIHGRTLNQGFAGSVDYPAIKNARKYFNGIILANGGVHTLNDAQTVLKNTGADGLGIARGALGRPWVFEEFRSKNLEVRSIKEILNIMIRHAEIAKKLKGGQGIVEMRKHLCWYVQGLPKAKSLRRDLVKVTSINDIIKIFDQI